MFNNFDPDDYCRTCYGTRGEGDTDCPRCEGQGGNLQVEGLDIRGEKLRRDRLRREERDAEAWAYYDANMRPVADPEDVKAAEKWREFLAKPGPEEKPNPQGEAWYAATMEWREHRTGDAPKWEDFS